jgi:hypothetical protein
MCPAIGAWRSTIVYVALDNQEATEHAQIVQYASAAAQVPGELHELVVNEAECVEVQLLFRMNRVGDVLLDRRPDIFGLASEQMHVFLRTLDTVERSACHRSLE